MTMRTVSFVTSEIYLGANHLTWRGGYGFLFRSEIFFRTTRELEYFFFFVAPTPFKLNGRSLILYDLSSITELQANLPLKISWKKLVRKEVEKFWLKRLQNDATAKTTLKYLAIKHLEVGTSQPLWKMKLKTRIAVKKSIIKARIITGTLVLQKDRHRFNKFDISSICPTTLSAEISPARWI